MQIINKLYNGGGGYSRIDYIDILKGFAIFCIIWCHTDAPSWNDWTLGNIGNIIFFLISGFFFKPSDDWKSFIIKKSKTILIPFLFFYLLSVPFRFLVDLWDYRTIDAYDWTRILDIFKIQAGSDYLSLNVPIWFLLTLFVIQLLANVFFRLPKTIIAVTAIFAFIFKEQILQWPTIFMFNNALHWYGYFTIGYLIGKPVMETFKDKRQKILLIITSFFLFFMGFFWIDIMGNNDSYNLIRLARNIGLFLNVLTLSSLLTSISYLEIVKYLGRNSLIILGSHLWFLIPLSRMSFLFTGKHDPLLGLIQSLIVGLLLIPFIYFLNLKLPFIVGKQNLLRIKIL